MKNPILETTPQSIRESFRFETIIGAGFGAQWHFHPEYQITFILKSRGHRVVGDNLAAIIEGEVILVGSNLPHVWYQDATVDDSKEAVRAIVIRFHEDFLGGDFLHKPELESVKRLFKRASRGLLFTGKTRDVLAARLEGLTVLKGMSRLVALLEILDLMAQSRETKTLSTARFTPDLKGSDQGRMARVLRYLHENLAQTIDRDQAAAHASLSSGAFSRFFKTRTGKTLPQYVNELRVGRACAHLADDEVKIVDLAMDCGFGNLANFNRQFQRLTGMTPRSYRRQFQKSELG